MIGIFEIRKRDPEGVVRDKKQQQQQQYAILPSTKKCSERRTREYGVEPSPAADHFAHAGADEEEAQAGVEESEAGRGEGKNVQ